jgi:ATP-dependent helicase/nuclease subunit B
MNNINSVTLTPNRRLSATLHERYQHEQTKNKNCWETPNILPISSWLQQLWQGYCQQTFDDTPQLLNPAQEQFIWEKILLASKEATTLLRITETAELARSAWGLLKQWRLPRDPEECEWMQWMQEFARYCALLSSQRKLGSSALDQFSLCDAVNEKIKTGAIIPPQQITLIGFTEVTPQFTELLKTCTTYHDTTIEYKNIVEEKAHCQRISFPDGEQEIRMMAQFAKEKLTENSNATIACVIPSLDKIRDRAQQIFSEVFANYREPPFNFSAGKSLLHYPIIYAAFQLLNLYKEKISLEHFSYLLTSPFVGEAEREHVKRCHYEKLLRQKNINHVQLKLIINDQYPLPFANYSPKLAQRLQQFFEQSFADGKTHTDWAAQFTTLLTILGWPGERSLNSEEYQLVESWLALLSDYQTLDQVSTPVYFAEALQTLQRMASNNVFQIKTPAANIQVLGVLEAASLPFDYIWLSSMDDVSFPPQPKPHPLLPNRLQRELQMPHATAERELLFCTQLLKQFKQSTPHLIFSFAEKKDELELQVSPLIRDVEEISLMQDVTLHQTIFASKSIETLQDDTAPLIRPDENIRGGVNIIKQQALCPFSAYAAWRLHAREFESTLPGFKPADRGTFLHKALELCWQAIQDQQTLISLSAEELQRTIQLAVHQTFEQVSQNHAKSAQYIALEKIRLQQLITDWLAIEKERPPFKVIASEQKIEFQLQQLSLSLRIDRIDELDNGKKLIIDYKTGKQNDINYWFSDRPIEPQLPLYALFNAQHIVGITFAQVATGEHEFHGMSAEPLDIKGIKEINKIKKITATNWQQQITDWQQVLTQLSAQFVEGVAIVDPKEGEKTCTWCALKPLCRINETGYSHEQ